MFLVFDWWLDVIWLKSHRNATNCIDFNIVIRILNTPVSANMAQGQRKWHVVLHVILLKFDIEHTPYSRFCFLLIWPILFGLFVAEHVFHRYNCLKTIKAIIKINTILKCLRQQNVHFCYMKTRSRTEILWRIQLYVPIQTQTQTQKCLFVICRDIHTIILGLKPMSGLFDSTHI